MTPESTDRGLLADFLDAAREEQDAWQALAECDQAITEYTDVFLRWKTATERSARIAARWQSAVGKRGT
jgi:hypothetical protein